MTSLHDPATGRYLPQPPEQLRWPRLLICPGHSPDGTYIEGCGQVQAIVQRRKIYVRPGKQAWVPVLVCPHCKTRLLPTRLEIETTRGRAT